MNYVENIYVCLAAPIFIAILAVGRNPRRAMTFILGGMTVCLLSSYISTFLAGVSGADAEAAAINISPIVEEIMKFLPVLFYMVVFEPEEKGKAVGALLMIAIGFATFENVCYLTQNGAGHLLFLTVRGFGTGTMHVVCGMLVSAGLLFMWEQRWLRAFGIMGLLSLAITYHGIYNMMVSQQGVVAYVGYGIPIVSALILLVQKNKMFRAQRRQTVNKTD
ncbi:MAG: PrsW family intramembrane metalloprotease [Firmicutes bacterium]|nr:PrsW family intramembrane metalloprotease [Bacillota bacterium]MBR2511862.1 PrsW family intramembrane metalloprotease [Bacillota bacterium]